LRGSWLRRAYPRSFKIRFFAGIWQTKLALNIILISSHKHWSNPQEEDSLSIVLQRLVFTKEE